MVTPPAEVAIDAALVRRLIATQHPELAACPLTPVAAGWDNEIYRLGDDLVVRLPRRALAATLVAHEQRWLPVLAPRLPIEIPVPVRTGHPEHGYPWPWSITPWFEGMTADLAELAAGEAQRLAAFLRALHAPAPEDAPRNPYRGVPLAERVTVYEQRRASLAARGEPVEGDIHAIWVDALAAPADTDPTWIHGDLHPRNVLVRSGRIAAIIDWGDVARGDRATDLAAVWLVLADAAARRRVIADLGDVPLSAWRRARGWAALQALILLDAGLADDPRMAAIGRATLTRLGADSGHQD